jgi:hypothetical protein
MKIADDHYDVQPAWNEEFNDLSRWRTLDQDGRWIAQNGSLVGEWIRKSPSLFFNEKIHGDYLWQMTATRLGPDEEFIRRFSATKWGAGVDPRALYNFNFWLRVNDPQGGDFFAEYPQKLGTGWNGMGDDYWKSLFTTIVRGVDNSNWVRLRKSPGYEKVEDVADQIPLLNYDEPHQYTFVLHRGRVRMYFDDRRIYDYADPSPMESGHIGLCVWLCKMRFENMTMYRIG